VLRHCSARSCEGVSCNKAFVLLRCLSLCNTQARAVNLIHTILRVDEGPTLDVSLGNTQARAVNLIPAILCFDEDVTQARGYYRHETGRGIERLHCTIYCLEFCAGFIDAKRQHLSIINTNCDLSFTTIQQQTYRRKQLVHQ